MLIREDLTKIADNTRVCSNHFVHGRPYGQHPRLTLYMRGYSSRENITENIDIQHIINSWYVNKENEDYIQTRKGGIRREMSMVDTPNERNNCSIRRDEMPLTEKQLALEDLNETAISSNSLESEKITNIQKEHQYARLNEQVLSVFRYLYINM